MSEAWLSALVIIGGYVLGSVSGSLLLGRLRQVDIRTVGSGNAGGTNALRTQGWRFALGVVLIDIGKGVLAAGVLPALLAPDRDWLPAIAGFAAVVGHIYPVFYGFRGGKGAATFLGALVTLWPLGLVWVLVSWAVVLVMSGYVGLATILAALVTIPLAALLASHKVFVFCLASALLITFAHRSNIARLREGTENRFERVRISNWWRRR